MPTGATNCNLHLWSSAPPRKAGHDKIENKEQISHSEDVLVVQLSFLGPLPQKCRLHWGSPPKNDVMGVGMAFQGVRIFHPNIKVKGSAPSINFYVSSNALGVLSPRFWQELISFLAEVCKPLPALHGPLVYERVNSFAGLLDESEK